MPAFNIRIATPDDAKLLAELGARLFDETFGAVNDPDDMRLYLAAAFSEELQRAELADPMQPALIAEDESGAAIGYAMMRVSSRGDGVAFHRPVEVQRIYVDKPWHGRGVGDALIDACVAHARTQNADGVWLAVWEENSRAIAFYKRKGFTPVGVANFILGRDVQKDLVLARSLE